MENTPVPHPLDEETCWQAVLQRDRRYDGQFYYGVRSTGVYCRPGCPARRPRREQVRFFASLAAAEQAGYRPCKRCQPQQASDPQIELVTRACRLIENAAQPPRLTELSAQLGVSPYHLQRLFKAITGVSPHRYAARLRLEQFKEQARRAPDVTSALYEAGYSSNSRLYENAAQQLGMTPAVYRRGGNDMQIHYTIVDCPLGRLLVAASPKGVCAVSLGDDDTALTDALHREYPAAALSGDDARLNEWARSLVAHLQGSQPRLELPLDVQASAFQLQVWEELRRIPYGETRSYTQVAEAIGRPSAVRAVARACATNPAALLTPCHRVLRSDGSLGGYRWGLQRKQALLDGEQRRTSADE